MQKPGLTSISECHPETYRTNDSYNHVILISADRFFYTLGPIQLLYKVAKD